ncbi:unnamed protein product [Sphagnum troendelagicum]|uniref:Glycosyltransferase subfamily 4-like N-terminal domain-containing protein n=1 Tax=Sphagnum troendelagicum TaxID=128251 RepID=A0ABP0V4A1_9BRYO
MKVEKYLRKTLSKFYGKLKPRLQSWVFMYVCGYKNCYQNFIQYLRELGDEVLVVTTSVGVPAEFYGAKVIGSWSLPFPWYKPLSLSLVLSPPIYREVANFKPDIIHASSSPGIMEFLHRAADLTLVMSHALGKEMNAAGVSTGCGLRQLPPKLKSQEMRNHLTVMGRIPHIRLAFVGDGPFSFTVVDIQGMNVTFTGMLQGEELSQAYASADIFITPSESETLGFVVLEATASGVSVVAARAGCAEVEKFDWWASTVLQSGSGGGGQSSWPTDSQDGLTAALDTSLFLFARQLRLKFIASQYPSSNQTPSVSLGLTD